MSPVKIKGKNKETHIIRLVHLIILKLLYRMVFKQIVIK